MPTYEYLCKNCSHELEIFQSITADPLTDCPQCRQATLQRKIGGGKATLRFQGSGFYLTDYRRKQSEPSSESSPKEGGCKKEGSCG